MLSFFIYKIHPRNEVKLSRFTAVPFYEIKACGSTLKMCCPKRALPYMVRISYYLTIDYFFIYN